MTPQCSASRPSGRAVHGTLTFFSCVTSLCLRRFSVIASMAGPGFDVSDAVVEHFPDQATKTVRDRPDRLRVAESWAQTVEDDLHIRVLLLHRGTRELVQKPAHGAVPLGRTIAARLSGTLLSAGTDPHPRCKQRRGRKALAWGPISAMICWAESIPNPSNSARRSTAF